MTSTSNDQSAQDTTPDPKIAPAEDQKPDTPAVNGETSLADDAMTLLSEHKGKLAIGVAATLGMMVYYGWREKRLAKTDPEEYARLQRLKAIMRHSDDAPKPRSTRKAAARQGDAMHSGEAEAGKSEDAGAASGADATPDKP